MAVNVAKIAGDKKALDIVILDIHKLAAITNYIVIATIQSTLQINAMSIDIKKF